MTKRYFRKMILLLLCLSCCTAYEDEDYSPSDEYIQIFQSIPALFEYLLDVVEQRPEVLETDDVTVFNRNQDQGTENRQKISYGPNNMNYIENIRSNEAMSDWIAKADTIANEQGDTIMKSNNEFKFINPSNRGINQEYKKHKRSIDGNKIYTAKNSDVNQLIESNGLSGVDTTFDMNWGETFIGFDNLFSLDYEPEDVVEQIIRIEELLENHNNKKE